MFKKLAFPAIAMMAMLALFVPSQASARVRFGIGIGAGPVYAAPYPAPVAPYAYPYSYPAYPNYYAAPAPVYPYASPYYYGGIGIGIGGGYWGHNYGRGFVEHGPVGRGFSGGHGFGGHGRR